MTYVLIEDEDGTFTIYDIDGNVLNDGIDKSVIYRLLKKEETVIDKPLAYGESNAS